MVFFLRVIEKLHSYSETPRGTTEFCPRLNGFYAHPDETECRIFYSCIDGVAEKVECPVGLYFDEFSGTCNWPEGTDRLNCKNGKYASNHSFALFITVIYSK